MAIICLQRRKMCLFWLLLCAYLVGSGFGEIIWPKRGLWDANISLQQQIGISLPQSPQLSGPACQITQNSGKHLGYQLEGKLSCALLSLVEPKRFQYVHTPFKNDEIAELERFFNLKQVGAPSKLSAALLDPKRNSREQLAQLILSEKEEPLFRTQARNETSPCQQDEEYVLENCMELLYEEPFVSKLRNGQSELLARYLQEPKPDVGFTGYKQTYNVVMYIRPEDARIKNVEIFYEWAVTYFLDRYPPNSVRVWVESDNSFLPVFTYWKSKFGKILTLPTNNGMDFFKTFHRLVMADGLVYFPSNLVMAATLLNNRTDTIIVPILDTKLDHSIHARLIRHRPDWFQQVDPIRRRTVGQMGFLSDKLIHMKQRVDKALPCPLTQYGKDGFGHQLEGKLSCALLSLIWPARFPYYHIPFTSIEHMTAEIDNAAQAAAMTAEVEKFVNFGSLFPPYNEVMDPQGGNPAFRADQLDEFVETVLKFEPGCQPNHTYIVDNCWQLAYVHPVVGRIDSVRHILREAYLKTPKPDTGFVASNFTRNVVVHMRNGDAGKQYRFYGLNESRFFVDGIRFYINKFNHHNTRISGSSQTNPLTVHFWIETDSPTWEPIARVQKVFASTPGVVIHMPDPTTPILTVFHRMVMADGLVMSPSSFSNSAAILSQADELVITTGDHGVHTLWMETTRFIRIR